MNQDNCNETTEGCLINDVMAVQYRAATVGFDWDNIQGVLDKVQEELDELSEAVHCQNIPHACDELGDLFFSAFSVARFLNADPRQCIKESAERFKQRFKLVENMALEEGNKLESCSAETLDAYWERAKRLALQ